MRALVISLVWLSLAVPAWVHGAEPLVEQRTVFVKEHQTLEPGYAVGNVAIGAADIADYKVMPGRKQLLIFGKRVGRTSLTIWDQSNVKRHEVLITVTTREEAQVDADLRDLLKDFPSVEVRRLRGDLVVAGTVETRQDLDAVQKIASAARAKSVVRLVPPPNTAAAPVEKPAEKPKESAAPKPAPVTPEKPASAASGASKPASPEKPVAAEKPAPPRPGPVLYDVELIEASSVFRTGSYGQGTQPSGPSLFKGEVTTAPGDEGIVFIPASAVIKDPAKQPKGEVGIRLKLRPTAPDKRGAYSTRVLVETNLPVETASDPQVWRNGRWQFPVVADAPFVIAGRDLLAIAAPGTGKSGEAAQLGKAIDTGSRVARLPGVSSVPEVGAATGVAATVRDLFGIWGGSRKEPPPTQLVVIVRPRAAQAEAEKK